MTHGSDATPGTDQPDPLPPPDQVPPPVAAVPSPELPPPPRWSVPPPVSEVPGAPGLTFADIPARIVAYLADAFIVGLVGASAAIAFGFGDESLTTTSSYVSVSGPTLAISFALTGFVYFVFFWSGGRRATIGQRLFDIQVGNAFDGRPLTLSQAVRRWVGYGDFLGLFAVIPALVGIAMGTELVWGLVLLATAARSPTKQGLHDRLARSALVRPSNRASGGPALACLVVLVFVGLLLVLGVVVLIFLGSQIGPLVRPPATTI